MSTIEKDGVNRNTSRPKMNVQSSIIPNRLTATSKI